MDEGKFEYPIYRMNEIHNMMCDLDVSKYVTEQLPDVDDYILNDGDVLFNRTNSYDLVGRSGIYYKKDSLTSYVFASYLVRFIPDKNKLLPEYLVAFLNTKYALTDIRRRSRQSINQTNVNPEEVKQLFIPILDINLQKLIQKKFYLAHTLRSKAKKYYSRAESMLSYQLGLDSFIPSTYSINIKTFFDSFISSGRLDSEYYQPKYDELFNILKKFNTQKLGGNNGVVNIKKSIEPGSKMYCENGIPFVRVSDITKFGISDPNIKLPVDVVKDVKLLYPTKNTILFSKDGSTGIAYKVEEDLNIITSSALLHLVVKDTSLILPDYLTLVLNSIVVQLQSERDSSGAVIQHWKPSEIENVLIPVLDIKIQEEISAKVQQSFIYQHQSEKLLKITKRTVEIAIEKDEDTAIQYINSIEENEENLFK